jgi:hypothetical protein
MGKEFNFLEVVVMYDWNENGEILMKGDQWLFEVREQ